MVIDKDLVVFLHASLSSKAQWIPLMQAWQTQAKSKLDTQIVDYLALDLLGYGSAAPPNQANFQLSTEVDVVYQQIQAQRPHLEKDAAQVRVHLIGHSYGAATALALAARIPEAIASMTLFEPVAFYLLDHDSLPRREVQDLSAILHDQLDTKPAQAAAHFIDYWNTQGTFARLPEAQQAYFIRGMTKVCDDFNALFSASTCAEDLQQLQCPILLMQGQQTPASTQAVMHRLREIFPQAGYAEVDGGHMAPITHAHLVNPIVTEFVAAHIRTL
ncbi:Pimeloyl-ACP methyl ester carboxylesterase [Allopseudospirillum japonicum]|uniref:Pimeloyl-ACP methyl ester carboxylesterase n=1 Tax=Allopseudospirillum japonicum TaxID=64971 RepID=A0A1H6SRX6_9GAMM|nr:alpha/beta hydrolase [Allopseudospirillum japonicum]SEI68524.1 Pimeloyl-ACP methyl ester carboxylesterase [Allopseudospirillum japonicum]